jgi:hypothetical protein
MPSTLSYCSLPSSVTLVGADVAVDHRRDAAQAVEVGLHVAADLQLVELAAIEARDLLQRLRQPVSSTRWSAGWSAATIGSTRPTVWRTINRGPRLQACEETRKLPCISGVSVARGDARHIGRDHLRKGLACRLADRIDDRAIEQRRPIRGNQRIEPKLGTCARSAGDSRRR